MSVIKTLSSGLFPPGSLAVKTPQRPARPEDTIVETIACEELDAGWGNGSSVVSLYLYALLSIDSSKVEFRMGCVFR